MLNKGSSIAGLSRLLLNSHVGKGATTTAAFIHYESVVAFGSNYWSHRMMNGIFSVREEKFQQLHPFSMNIKHCNIPKSTLPPPPASNIVDISSLDVHTLFEYIHHQNYSNLLAEHSGAVMNVFANTLTEAEKNQQIVTSDLMSKSFHVSKEILNRLKNMNDEHSKSIVSQTHIFLFKLSILGKAVSIIEKQYKHIKQIKGALQTALKGLENEIYVRQLYDICSENRTQLYNLGVSIYRDVLAQRPTSLFTKSLFEAIFQFMEKETMYEDIKPVLERLYHSDVTPTLKMYSSICSNLYYNRTSKLIYPFLTLVKDTFGEGLFTPDVWNKYSRNMYAYAFSLDVDTLPTNLVKNLSTLLEDTKNVDTLFFYEHPMVFKSIVNAMKILNYDDLLPFLFCKILQSGNLNQTFIRLLLEYLDQDLHIFSNKIKFGIPELDAKYFDIFEMATNLVHMSNLTEVVEIQNYLLKYCLREGRLDKVDAIYHHIERLNAETLVLMFNIYEKTGNFVDANLLMRRARTEEFTFTKEVVAAYFKSMIAAKRDCLDEFISFTHLYTFVRLGDPVFQFIFNELNNIKKGLVKETDNKVKSVLED
ncbi:hypothetical protein C9374_004599 [Naegleria lovaniensis]|uniref:Uncharacterized protein n=1 Tax=Naegleria lovaniensis TaxID=51637 RepID=A0AA88GRK6_NAELO|nr:uncharacterized protein C9374_004599 [Naegleria lovaniensis]KAG2383262.1 hypothetical protein C9374_004599 [Naegleria lovaniensis]